MDLGYIAGAKLRSGMPETERELSRQGRCRTVKDNLRVKEIRVDGGDTTARFIVCHNPVEAGRDRIRREKTIARIEIELDRLAKERGRVGAKSGRVAHRPGECALRDHKTLGRYLRQTETGRLLIDREKVKAEERLDGKYLLTASDPDLSSEDVALGYRQLLETERSFRPISRCWNETTGPAPGWKTRSVTRKTPGFRTCRSVVSR